MFSVGINCQNIKYVGFQTQIFPDILEIFSHHYRHLKKFVRLLQPLLIAVLSVVRRVMPLKVWNALVVSGLQSLDTKTPSRNAAGSLGKIK